MTRTPGDDACQASPGRSTPTLDTWIAYLSGQLLEEESDRLRTLLQQDEELRSYVCELSDQFRLEGRAVEAPDIPPLEHHAVSGRKRWAAAAAIFVLLGAAVFFALSTGPTHEVDADFARATQVGVVGGLGATQRSTTGETSSTSVIVTPSMELTLSVAVPGDADVWFFECDLETREVRSIARTDVVASENRIGFARYEVPADIRSRRLAVLTLVAQSAFADDDAARVRAIVKRSSTLSEIESEIRRSFGCVFELRELSIDPDDAVPETPRKKFGSRESSDRPRNLERTALRKQLREVDSALRATSLARARTLLAQLDRDLASPDVRADGHSTWWEHVELKRLRTLAKRIEAAPEGFAHDLRTAEDLRTQVLRAFAMAISKGVAVPRATVTSWRESLQRGAQSLRHTLDEADPVVLRYLHLEAKLLLQLGNGDQDLDDAFRQLETVRQGLDAASLATHPLYGSVLNDIAGACREQGLLHRALAHATAAVRVFEGAGIDTRVLCEGYRALADIHLRLGNAAASRRYADRASDTLASEPARLMPLRRTNLHLSRAALDASEAALCDDDRRTRLLASAERELDLASRALENNTAALESRSGIRSAILSMRAELAFLEGDLDAATRFAAALREADADRFDESHPFLAMDDYLDGRIALSKGAVDRARVLLERSFSALEERLIDATDARDRAALSKSLEIDAIADDLAEACIAQGDVRAAFEAQERARARKLLDLFSSGTSPYADKEIARLRRERGELHFAIETLDAVRADGISVEAELDEKRKRLAETLQAEWRAERVAARKIRAVVPESEPGRCRDLSRALKPGDALWYFSRSDDGLRLFFVAPSGAGRAVESYDLVKGRRALRRFEADMRAAIEALGTPGNPTRDGKRLAGLTKVLVPAAVLTATKRAHALVVVPDGLLRNLPVEALVLDAADSWTDCRFLADALPPTTYVASLSTLLALGRFERQPSGASAGPRGVLLIGNPKTAPIDRLEVEARAVARSADDRRATDTGLPTLTQLPETDSEIRLLETLLRAHGETETRLLSGADANLDRVFEFSANKAIVHIAAHGRLGDAWRPLAAGVSLTPAESQPFGSGLLGLEDVLARWPNRDGSTRLVVLSACDSGSSRDGEFDCFSFPAALHHVGVRSVVASLWKVDSVATVSWMSAYYERLVSKTVLAPASAMREAKSALRRAMPDPSHWAPFVHFGVTDARD